jgi:D-alanyl-D-alanine carboxypeptidase (penicillin-binding protein 5/6)
VQDVTGRRTAAVLGALAAVLCTWAAVAGPASAETPHTPAPTPSPHAGPHRGTPRQEATAGPTPTEHAAAPTEHAAAAAPASGSCNVPVAPPPAIDASERPSPGEKAPMPLPVPAQPVGGPRMGECGLVVPPGAPPPPAGEDSVSWVIADLDSGAVLAARNPHARERPASLLKILTSLVIMKNLDMNTVVAGTEQDADAPGSRVGVGPGGQYTVRQLFTGLIMNSGNDAANALARTLGGVPATLRDMAQTAAAMGGMDTRPTSPSGLDALGMSTSAYDLALFYRQAIKQPVFAEISNTRLFDWPGRGKIPGFKISNDNHMLTEYPGTFGGKTGFTDDARHTRITAAARNGRRLVVVQMRGEQHPVSMDTQAARLLDYGFALPADSAPVGQLVDQAPDQATDDTGAPAPAEAAPEAPEAAPASESSEHRMRALGTIGGGAVLGALLSWLVARRGGRGEQPTEPDADEPDEPEAAGRGGRHAVRPPRD